MSSVASAQTRQRPCRLPARWAPPHLACPARSATVRQRGKKHRNPDLGNRRCRDRGRRHRRQRRRLFSEHGCRNPRPPHRARRARPRLSRGQHRTLGRRDPAAVLDAREHRHVAVHAGDVPPAAHDLRRRGRRGLSRAGLSDHGDARGAAAAGRERGFAAIDGRRHRAARRRRPRPRFSLALGGWRGRRRLRPGRGRLVRPDQFRCALAQSGHAERRRHRA